PTPTQALESSPQALPARGPPPLPACQDSYRGLLLQAVRGLNLHQRIEAMHWLHRLIQQIERALVRIQPEHRGLRRVIEPLQRPERIVHTGSLIPRMHHAIRAFGVPALSAVVGP